MRLQQDVGAEPEGVTMNPFLWFLFAWLVLGALITIGQVGKERKPIEPAQAVGSVIITACLCVILVVGASL